jgi:polysaccharide pyruvyl transferase WcaK-like protein
MIYIKGVAPTNKGAELMLYCITRRLQQSGYGNHEIMAAPSPRNPDSFRILASSGVLQSAEYPNRYVNFERIARILPKPFLRSFGIAPLSEANIVLDASGLSYTDRFGKGSLMRIGSFYRQVKRRGGKIVLLPQAFGPLTVPRFQNRFREILLISDRVFARDQISYAEALKYVDQKKKISICPDLTIGENFIEIEPIDEARDAVGIIPNFRLFEKGVEDQDVSFLLDSIRKFASEISKRGCRVFFILHEGPRDEEICHRIVHGLNLPIPILSDVDPRRLKNTIGLCRAVLSFRYHGCVSALSQGVPCYNLGWNHKYAELFSNFCLPENSMDISEVDWKEKLPAFYERIIGEISDPSKIANLRSQLLDQTGILKKIIDDMWLEVYGHIFNS